MYLLTLANSVVKSSGDANIASANHLSRSPAPMAHVYGGALNTDPVKTIKESLTLKGVVWKPVNCGDMVVYVRRALGC